MPSETYAPANWDDERRPLLDGIPSIVLPKFPSEANFTFSAIMVCGFLAAFDITVVAAIYSVMSYFPKKIL
jgi:hypothetical protein